MSADLQLLAARIQVAHARGERLDLDEAMVSRLPEFEAQQRAMRDAPPRFLSELDRDVRGKSTLMIGLTNVTFQLAQDGLAAGIEGLFAPDSVVMVGGGGKGIVLPPDFEDIIARFAGVPAIDVFYGMSELNTFSRRCERGGYHVAPTSVLYLL